MEATGSAIGLKAFFLGWPAEMPRRGIIITATGEQITFSGFMTRPDLLLVERTTPDSMGGRVVVVPYEGIASLKLTDPAKQKFYERIGFTGALAAK